MLDFTEAIEHIGQAADISLLIPINLRFPSPPSSKDNN
jgi:hypothetical protein